MVQCVLYIFQLVQAELLEALEEEQKQQESKKTARKKKKAVLKSSDKAESVDSPSDASDSQKVVTSPEPACTKCAILQGPQQVSKRGKACCAGCKPCDAKHSKQPSAAQTRKPSTAAVRGLSSPHSHTVHSPVSLPSGLLRLSSSSSSSSQSASTSTHTCSGSRSPTEPGTPGSMTSQQTDDGWEVQQRSKRMPAALEKQASLASQPRACRTLSGAHAGLAAAWHSVPGTSPHSTKPHMKDVLVHHVHVTPSSTERLHLATGPVSFQPPPPPPPPRTRVAATACKEEKAPHAASPPTVNAWNLSGKGSLVTHSAVVTHNAWTSAVHQVNNSLCSCLYMEVQSSIKWSRCFCHGVICHLWTAKAVLQLLLLYRVAFNNRLDRVAAHSSSIKLVAASAKLSSTMMHSADFVPFCHHLYTECITPSLH